MQREHCGVVVRALDLQSEGRGFESHSVRTPLDRSCCEGSNETTIVVVQIHVTTSLSTHVVVRPPSAGLRQNYNKTIRILVVIL